MGTNFPEILADDLAASANTYYAHLLAWQQHSSAREVAEALRLIAVFACSTYPRAEQLLWAELPWSDLPLELKSVEIDPMRAALSIVGEEARTAYRKGSSANLTALAEAAESIAKMLEERARKTGAPGPTGSARHTEAAHLAETITGVFKKRGLSTALSGKDDAKEDFASRKIFHALRTVMRAVEKRLVELVSACSREVNDARARRDAAPNASCALRDAVSNANQNYKYARSALLRLRAARDAPTALRNAVSSANRNYKCAQFTPKT